MGMSEPSQPTTPEIEALRVSLSRECFARRLQEAHHKVKVLDALGAADPGQAPPSRATLRELGCLDRSNALRWWKQYRERPGEPWERLFHRLAPTKLWEVPEAWRHAVQGLGHQQPPPTWEQIRDVLVRQFGPQARLCRNTIVKILQDKGLAPGGGRPAAPVEEVVELTGGGLLVLVQAASLETGAVKDLAEGVQWVVQQSQAPPTWPIEEEPAGRDEQGRLTAAYNQSVVARLQAQDPPRTVFQSTEEAVVGRDMRLLRVGRLGAGTLVRHLSALVALPLVTERRGTVGLRDPAGAWLATIAGRDYQPATLEKTLNGLKALSAGFELWECHARTWQRISARWLEGEPAWRQIVAYIDGSKDPWWTERFARSGKVERTGRVQPCLERTVLATGAGVPLLAQVVSGNDDLSKAALQLLARCDTVLGAGMVGRLTVVDAACCKTAMMQKFSTDPDRNLVTVLKGPLARGKVVEPRGEWLPYRERDQIREASVELLPGQPDGLLMRAVVLVRRDSRHPHPTVFLTTASPEELPTPHVVDAYLDRWANIENRFRRGRAGLGWERTDGFGASRVSHFAVMEKRQAAARKLRTSALVLAAATDSEAKATLHLAAAEDRLIERHAAGALPLDGRHRLGVRQGKHRLVERQKAVRAARKQQDAAAADKQRLDSMPSEIYVRDTWLDTITACMKMTLLCLLEFVCKEYLGGHAMQPRTLCAAWMNLPVTVRTTPHRALYEVAPNPRDHQKTGLLRQALAEVTRRKLRDADGRLIVARLRGEGEADEARRDP
jgi:hypothetical protein